MKKRTSTALAALTLMMASMASMASAQTIIRDSGNGTGNLINAGGGFGPTEIHNSANGDYNTINVDQSYNAEPSYRHTVSPHRYQQTYTVRREVFPPITTVRYRHHIVPGYQALPKVRYAPAPPRPNVYPRHYPVSPAPFPVRNLTGRTEIHNSGNGTNNTINARGGFGVSVTDSGNGDNNTINIGH